MKKEMDKKIENRGRPITCRYCGQKFKIKEKEKKKKWIEDLFPCPQCGTFFCFLTETEKELQIIQNKYKRTKEEKYIIELFYILKSYAESIIKKHYINLIKDKSLLSYYAESAASLLIEDDFYKKDNFFIDTSFGSRLNRKCRQAILSSKESLEYICKEDSLDYVFEDGNTVTHEDTTKTYLDLIEEKEEKFLLCERICNLLFALENECDSPLENYIRLINIHNYLEGGEKAIDKFFECYGRYGKYKTLQSLNILKNELQKEI